MAESLPEEDFTRSNKNLKLATVILFALGIFTLSLGLGLFFKKDTNNDIQILSSSDSSPQISEIVVDIAGAVTSPGVYKLPNASRANDAIEKAGGLTQDADRSKINLAAKIVDGQKLIIPRTGETVSQVSGVTGQVSNSLININTATEAELDKLPGVGPVTAQKIISSRPFSVLEDLVTKKVVSNTVFEKIKDLISLY